MNELKEQAHFTQQRKNGVPYVIGWAVVWVLITAFFLLPMPGEWQGAVAVLLTGFAYPFSLITARAMKAVPDPCGMITEMFKGGRLHIAAVPYLCMPILFWMAADHPGKLVLALSIVAGVHFWTSGTRFGSIPYFIMSIIIPIGSWALNLADNSRTVSSAATTMLFFVFSLLIYEDYRRKLRA